jgi:hypothetical protein
MKHVLVPGQAGRPADRQKEQQVLQMGWTCGAVAAHCFPPPGCGKRFQAAVKKKGERVGRMQAKKKSRIQGRHGGRAMDAQGRQARQKDCIGQWGVD